ncbi:hypothetical protein [Sphingomonas colocasiae]|uniref:Uncharacterized protein n=1 Tax=Sphingomonas colocasiae TaxID=1848973 RepID=A0ABS7PKM8_9SPHN|nr:hypothetical protein [Sphingomonas colocasiae]MBY8821847.1 hypothetical protein [Sphingomonas colocasiae]
MIEAFPIAGLFALACMLQTVDPLTGAASPERHAMSLVTRDGEGSITGWPAIEGQDRIAALRLANGEIHVRGLGLDGMRGERWAVLEPASKGRFTIEWLMHDRQAANGNRTVAVWAKGVCEPVDEDSRR